MRFLVAFLTIFGAVVLFFDAMALRLFVPQMDTSRWLQTTGTLRESSVVAGSQDDSAPTYEAKVSYEYQVGGQVYHSERLRFASGGSSDGWARDWVEHHPAGSKVEVSYNPQHPDQSVLIRGISGFDLYLILFLLPFHGAVITGFTFVGETVWRKARYRDTAGYPTRTIVGGSHLILYPRSPLTTFWGGWTMSAFVLSLGQAFLGGFHPTWERAVVLHICALALALMVFFRIFRVSRNNATDLYVTKEGVSFFEMPLLDSLLANPKNIPHVGEILRGLKGSRQKAAWALIRGFPVYHEPGQEEASERWLLTISLERAHVIKSFPDEHSAQALSLWLERQRPS